MKNQDRQTSTLPRWGKLVQHSFNEHVSPPF
jgi:hypothetical protein